MKSRESQAARQIRLSIWAAQIRECNNRPDTMTVEDWCKQNHVTRANYYYRLRCVREECLNEFENQSPAFVEVPTVVSALPATMSKPVTPNISEPNRIAAVLHTPNGFRIDIMNGASADTIRYILGVMSYAE